MKGPRPRCAALAFEVQMLRARVANLVRATGSLDAQITEPTMPAIRACTSPARGCSI